MRLLSAGPLSHTAHREIEIKGRRLAFTHRVPGLLGRGRVRGGRAGQQLLRISLCKAAVSGHQLLVEAAGDLLTLVSTGVETHTDI